MAIAEAGRERRWAKALSDSSFRHGEDPVGAAAGSAGPGPWRSWALGATASTLGLGAVTAWLLLSPGPSPGVARFELTLPDDVRLLVDAGVNMELSPDGSSLVFVGTGTTSTGQLWIRRFDQLVPTSIPGTEAARSPRFSPDGQNIAFITNNNGMLRTVSLGGAPPLTVIAEGVPAGSGGLAWGVGGWLYYVGEGQGLWRISVTGGEAERITTVDGENGVLGHQWPDALPNGRGVLVTLDRGGPDADEVGVVSLETGEVRSLFQGAMARYAVSGHLLFATGEGVLLAAPFDQDRLEVTGPARTLLEGIQVNVGSASYFALSPSGTLLYRPGGGTGGTGIPLWVSRDGTEEILGPTLPRGVYGDPAVSPDGRKVAFEYGASDVWVYDGDQETFSRLTFEGVNADPFWGPDSREVGFTSDRGGPQRAIYARPADLGEEARLLVTPEGGSAGNPAWAADGGSVVYTIDPFSDGDLGYADIGSGGAPEELLSTPFYEGGPALSPDGRWVAYHSDESGEGQVYVRPFPGPGGRYQISVAGNSFWPQWSADGQEIFYVRGDGMVMAAAVRTEPDFSVESREPLFSAAAYAALGQTDRVFSPAPDGERFLVVSFGGAPGSSSDVREVIVQNFLAELRRTVPD